MNYADKFKLKVYLITAGILLLLSSCVTEPQAIIYGEDSCHFCKMTISDQRFGAEIITKKGKVFKYDAIECMLKSVSSGMVKSGDVEQSLVTDVDKPGTLINSQAALYLISENFPSPMGANLSAYGTEEGLNKALEQYQGNSCDWTALRSLYKLSN